MNENAKKWIAALRSGDYKQTTGRLRYENQNDVFHCCLGVACEVAIANGVPVTRAGNRYNGKNVTLPYMVQDWLGLSQARGSYMGNFMGGQVILDLVGWNDLNRRTFDEIADFIESEPEGLFRQTKEEV